MNLATTQLKDTYGNLVTTGTTEGAPTSGGLQNGQGTLLTSVGIGTNTTSKELSIQGNTPTIEFIDAQDTNDVAQFRTSAGNAIIDADVNNDKGSSYIAFTVDGTSNEKMRIDSSGNVGIGTNLPDTKLHNVGTTLLGNGAWPTSTVGNSASRVGMLSTSNQILVIANTNGTVGANNGAEIYLGATATTSTADMAVAKISGKKVNATSGNKETYLAFSTSTSGGTITERMRIDSSGNLMVGTDNLTWQSVAGLRYFNGSSLNVTRDGNEPLNLNRLTSDGDIAIFRKDSTEVGVIGTADGQLFIANEAGSVDAGLLFGEAGTTARAIIPSRAEGTVVDNALDLGYASGRFKDLYLGGSVYLGGTTSANALDDYEEGTHDTTITCGTSGTITLGGSTQALQYTKIGRLVTVSGRVAVSGVSSPTGNFTMSLPFTIADLDDNSGRSTGGIKIFNTSTNVDNFFFTAHEGNAFITVFKGGSTNGTSDSADTFSGNETIALSITYVAA